MATMNNPSQSPRRVLGELAPKAINTPSKQSQALEAARAQSPLKQVQTLSPHILAGKENMTHAVTSKAGRKRSINEVDGAENVDRAGTTTIKREGGFWRTGAPLQAATLQKLAEQGNAKVDAESDDDSDDGGSTVANTPTPEPVPELEPEVVDNSQTSQQSFSNFLNYDACASQTIEPGPSQLPTPPKSSRAELLRLRLGLATYKVRTNQVDKTGSEIISNWESATSLSSADLNASTSTAATTSSTSAPSLAHPIPSITLSPARRAHPARQYKEAISNLSLDRPYPKLTGGPQLLPTAVTARMAEVYDMPSSPPIDQPKCVSPEQIFSPTRKFNAASYETPDQSPVMRRVRGEEGSEEGSAVSARMQGEKRFEGAELTSSAVKGNAAKGLMQLMNGRR